MKTIINTCRSLVLAICIGACSTPVHVEKDQTVNLANYKTYMWVDTRYNENDNTTRPAAYAELTVRNAASESLTNAGWTETSYNPDILVSYDVLVQSSTSRRSDPVYTRSFTRVYYNPRLKRWGTIYYPSQFLGYDNYNVPIKEGTISITLTDARTGKIVWQAWTTDELNYSNITKEEIAASTKHIFDKFDVVAR